MRRLAVPGLLLLALVGAGLWLGPQFLEWSRWRAQLEGVASDRLGRPVTLGGRITLSLLPQPRLEAGDVAIGPGPDGVALTGRVLRLRLALVPLLRGRLEPREMALVGGTIRLPWPPSELPSLRPPAWLTELDARVEDSRLQLGTLTLEGFGASLATRGAAEALVSEGGFTFQGQALRFSARIARAGADGVAPLDLTLAAGPTTLAARGALQPGGSFEGRIEAAGPDLSQLLPAPAAPFRASGRLNAIADLLEAGDLALEVGGQAARGSVTLRLAPEPRVDVAVTAPRLDLDAWLGALRAGPGRGLPLNLDLAVEATSFGGVPLRRLRGGFFLTPERLTLSDVSAILPGDTTLEVAGATARRRLELGVRFQGNTVRETLQALGLPMAGADATRFRRGEGRFRLVLDGGATTISDLTASIDGARITGDGVLRQVNGRTTLGLGLTFDRLDLDGLLPGQPDWPAMVAAGQGMDLNLRLAVDRLLWRGTEAQRAALDATLDGGRLALRRLAMRLGGLDLSGSGTAVLGTPTRFSDLVLEAAGSVGPELQALLPAAPWLAALSGQPLALRLTGNGVPEAIGLRAESDVGELRLEAAGTLDATHPRGAGHLTLRHPGAARLLLPLLGPEAAEWLGRGSFSMIAALAGNPQLLTAENLDITAGNLRARSRLALATEGPRPRLTGRMTIAELPLPELRPLSEEPLPLAALQALDAELDVSVRRVQPLGGPALEALGTRARLQDGTFRLDGLQARLAGGALEGGVVLEGAAQPPRLALDAKLTGAVADGPVLGLPLDLGAGRVDAGLHLSAAGYSPAAMVATLAGSAQLEARDGTLLGLDLGRVQAAAQGDARAAEAALRQGLAGGATAFTRLRLDLALSAGQAVLEGSDMASDTALATATGGIDLPRGMLDLRIGTRPLPEAPEVQLRLSGPAAAPRRTLELAPFLRWRAER